MTCSNKCIHYPVCEQKNWDFANIDECKYYMKNVERPKGEWINEYYDGLWHHTCSRCNTEIEFDRTVKRLGGENFCRNCGADMRGN